MKVKSMETLSCDAGWRNYHFVKLNTDTGITGWSEFDEGFGAPGVGTVIEQLSARIIGQEVGAHERIYAELHSATRPASGGIVALAMGAIENARLDWVEVDSFVPEALGYIRRHSPHPISSCETLLGLREFMPYFREQAMDVAIVDTPWNGVWQSMKIAAAAEAHEVNVAPHNFYGHLCTMMNAHFAAAVPNLRIMETDIDRIAWDHELFSHLPEFVDGHLVMPSRPGWGIEPNEAAIRARPPKGPAGLLNYGRNL